MYRYFSDIEFQRCTPPCSIKDMDADFMFKLDNARHISKIPFVPLSGFRSKIWELEEGRDGSSSHTKGIAIDLKADNSSSRYQILQALILSGFSRIGIGKNFIHADLDKSKAQNVIWHYYG